MGFEDLLVVIPHGGFLIPQEIPPEDLSDDFPEMIRNVDWHTEWLYDFRDFLGNTQTVFAYCSLILESNRHPDVLDDSVPLLDIHGRPVYRPGREPAETLRRRMSNKYLRSFHRDVGTEISRGKRLLLDGHSTVSARGMSDNQIELMNYQVTEIDGRPRRFCPDIMVEAYAESLRKRLPDVKITVNGSDYHTTYGHVCAAHSVDSLKRQGRRAPAILQETNEKLYRNPDRSPDLKALNRLRRAFAESLAEIPGKAGLPAG